jgi:hypothetical protein
LSVRRPLFAGAVLEILTQNTLLSSGVTAGAELWQRLKRLSRDEQIVLDAMFALSSDPYRNWVKGSKLRQALPVKKHAAKRLLAEMASRRILAESQGMWRVVH